MAGRPPVCIGMASLVDHSCMACDWADDCARISGLGSIDDMAQAIENMIFEEEGESDDLPEGHQATA